MSRFIRKKHKVFNLIIGREGVDMMDDFFRFKIPPNMFFHNKSMFKNGLPFIAVRMFRAMYSIITVTIFSFFNSARGFFLCFTDILAMLFRKLFALPIFRAISFFSFADLLASFFGHFSTLVPRRFSFFKRHNSSFVKGCCVIVLCCCVIVNTSHADKLGIPTVNPILFQENLAAKGFKLDFTFADRTPDSWGLLGFDDRGMCVNTYEAMDLKRLPIITEAMWASMED